MTALAPRPRTATASAAALLDAAIDGDEGAWTALCDRHLAEVRAVAHARLRDAHAVDDVVQETMLRAWTRLHQVRDPQRLGAWLKTVAANVAIDHVRRQRSTAPLEAAAHTPSDEPAHDELLVAAEEASQLHARLAELRDKDREALWQRDGLGTSVGELADQLDMTRGSVRVLLTRARKQLRDSYGALVAPLLGLVERIRTRAAGLGDAVPVALAAPAVVVAVVATTVGTTAPPEQPSQVTPASSVRSAPLPAAAISTPVAPTTAEDSTAAEPVAPVTTPSPAAADPVAPEQSAPRSAPVAPVADGGVVASDDAPTDDDKDADVTSDAGPVNGVEVYLEETGLLGNDQEQACLALCGDGER